MKVLLISAYFPLKLDDLAHSFVRDEAFELSKAGVDVYVARWRCAGRFLVQWIRLLMRADYFVTVVGFESFSRNFIKLGSFERVFVGT